ncbi:hypothetical protein [Nocardiopsis coralliicola]
MSRYAELAEALSSAVLAVPGVAFLTPGLADRFRAALPDSGGPVHRSGLRVARTGPAAPWTVDVRIVARADARTLDVARAAAAAADACVAVQKPGSTARVTVTVTGIV